MCNTTCNNHTHEEYNVDYIERELALDITTEHVPCQHEQNVYVVEGEYDENDQCNCKCSKCDEPKKVSCRSLACQQLNDECSCKRKKKVRKTTMVSMLENNVIRLEDKMNNGCADMHENIEDLKDNVNKVYNELKDEEARAKQQEAFLHYGLDDAVTRAWYNPADRKIHFYHKNPANCLNVNVNEGCDCDCCNACGCECKCNNDECSSDIPYTMDDRCNIIPMRRDEEELPFTIDCTDFLKDIFVSNAYLKDDYPNDDQKEGPILVILYKRYLEPGLEEDPNQPGTPPGILEVNLSLIFNLKNYYNKQEVRDEIKKLRLVNTYDTANPGTNTIITRLYYRDEGLNDGEGGDVLIGDPIEITMPNVTNTFTEATFGETTTIANVGDKPIKIKMPSAPEQQGSVRHITNITQDGDTVTFTWSEGEPATTTITVGGSGGGSLWEHVGDYIIPIDRNRKVYGAGFYDTTVN